MVSETFNPNLPPDLPYLTTTWDLPDGPAQILRLPGVPAPGPAHTALFRAVREIRAERVFVAGPGSAATALWAARSGAEVGYWTYDSAEASVLRATFAEEGQSPPRLWLQPGFEGLPAGTYPSALIHLPRGRALQQEMLALAGAMVEPGGRIAFVGAKNEGVKRALKAARQRFGHAGIVARKSGWHAGLSQRPREGDFLVPSLTFQHHPITVAGQATELVSCEGAFAADRLDVGAAALIAGLAGAPLADAQVLDLGCGAGLVGLVAARRGASVTFTDVSARAIASTRETLTANGITPARLVLGWATEGLPAGAFDLVATNPPFHQGHDVTLEIAPAFIRGARRVLRPAGTLYLVANAFLPYEPWLREHFARVTTAFENGRFRVWQAT